MQKGHLIEAHKMNTGQLSHSCDSKESDALSQPADFDSFGTPSNVPPDPGSSKRPIGSDSDQPGPSRIYKPTADVLTRLETFVDYFVEAFESKLYAYLMVLEVVLSKDEGWSDKIADKEGKIWDFVLSADSEILLGAANDQISVVGRKKRRFEAREGNKVLLYDLSKRYFKTNATLLELLNFANQNDLKAPLRKLLVTAGFDIFQSFEAQFMDITSSNGLRRVAYAASNRAQNYLKENGDTSISKAVILGKSKEEKNSLRHQTSFTEQAKKLLKTGQIPGSGQMLMVRYHGSDWHTSSLYEESGVVIDGGNNVGKSYYRNSRSRPEKYGYRRPLLVEDLDDIKTRYNEAVCFVNHHALINYKYVLQASTDFDGQAWLYLGNLKICAEAIKEKALRKLLREIKKEFIGRVAVLKRQSKADDRFILMSIDSQLQAFDVEECFQKLKKYLADHFKKMNEEFRAVALDRPIITECFRQKLDSGFDELSHSFNFGISPSKYPISFCLEAPVSFFTGREDEILKLHSLLQYKSGALSSQVAIISGLGGVGKTELAKQYINQFGDFYLNKVWIRAEKEIIMESFHDLTTAMRTPMKDKQKLNNSMEEIAQKLYKFLSQQTTLLVFDDANNFETISKFLPKDNNDKVYVLITSREANWINAEVLDLGCFPENDCILLVKKCQNISEEDDSEIKEFVRALHFFPLALHQATEYIHQEDEKYKKRGKILCTIGSYLVAYQDKSDQLLDPELFDGLEGEYFKTMVTTYRLTNDALKRSEYGRLAIDIINIMSFLSPYHIPIEFLFLSIALDPTMNSDRLWNAIELLDAYAMIRLESGQCSIHKLVQEVIRLQIEEEGKTEEVLRNSINILRNKVDKNTVAHALSIWNHASKSENKELIRDLSTISSKIVSVFKQCERPEDADGFGKKASGLLERVLGPNNLDTLTTLRNIGSVVSGQVNVEALNIYPEFDEIEKPEGLGIRHPADLTRVSNIASVLVKQGKYQEALKMYVELYDKLKLDSSPAHVSVLATQQSIAAILDKQGKYEQALNIYTEVYDLEKMPNVLGPEHPITLTTRGNIASVLSKLGKYEEGLSIYEEINSINELQNVFSPDDQCILNTQINIGWIHEKQGKYLDALSIYKMVYKKRERTLGRDHLYTLSTLNNIASVLDRQGKYEEALNIYMEVYDRHRCVSGLYDPATLTIRNNIAAVLCNQGKFEEAYSISVEVYDNRKEVLGPEHPDTLTTRNNIAAVLCNQGKYEDAFDIYTEVYEISKKVLGHEHPLTLSVQDNMAYLPKILELVAKVQGQK